MTTKASLLRELHRRANPEEARFLMRFFKTGKGEYGEGDRFIGVRVPVIRSVARQGLDAELEEVRDMLHSPVHEERLLALLLLVESYKSRTVTPARQKAIYQLYMANTRFINNWDLVDLSAPGIVGRHLENKSRRVLDRLAGSTLLWDRRIAIIATLHFIRRGELADTFRLADRLLRDPHDLMHKAVGWMLREAGKRDGRAEREFLLPRYRAMPRTMLRYAIEKFPENERQDWLKGRIGNRPPR